MRIHQSGYWIPDWIRFVAQVDTGYRIGYEICLILMDTVSGTGYMYPDIPVFNHKTLDKNIANTF